MHEILSDIGLKKWCRVKKNNSMRFTILDIDIDNV